MPGQEHLHVVVEAETGEAFEIAAEGDADHMRRELLDALDHDLAPARLMPHPLRRAGVGLGLLGGNG